MIFVFIPSPNFFRFHLQFWGYKPRRLGLRESVDDLSKVRSAAEGLLLTCSSAAYRLGKNETSPSFYHVIHLTADV